MATIEPPERIPVEIVTDAEEGGTIVWEESSRGVGVTLSALPVAVAELRFVYEEHEFLNLRAAVNGQQEAARVRVSEDERLLRWMADVRRYDETHRAFINGWDNGYPFSASYDPRSDQAAVGVSLVSWLSPATVDRITDVYPELRDLSSQLDELRSPYESDIRDLIHQSRFRDQLEAACWGLSGIMVSAGTDLINIPTPHHHAEAVKLALAGVGGYAAAMCAKLAQRGGT